MPKKSDGDWIEIAWYLADKYPREPDKVQALVRLVYHARRSDTYGASQLAFDMDWSRKKARKFIELIEKRASPGATLGPDEKATKADHGIVRGQKGASPGAMLTFEEFWKIYPRKVAKQKAWESWQRINPDSLLVDKIINSVKLQMQSWSDPKYIPHPATWLNQHRWEDQLEVELDKPKPFAWVKKIGEQRENAKSDGSLDDDLPF